MSKALFGFAAAGFATSAFLFVSPAAADPYRWCADYEASFGGTNCGFVTLQQCLDTVSGIGGFCRPNLFYTGPDREPRRRVRKRHSN